MNELYFTINFSKQKFIINGVDLISGDYNSTKIKFNFEDYKEGTKIIEIRPAQSEDKNPTFMSTIINNEVILTSTDEENHKISPFTNGGVYLVEVSVYGEDSKLSTITKSLNILDEQIVLSDEIVTPYLSIFDELMQEINTAINETNNLNISISKENSVTTITLTKKDGTLETFNILDGVNGTDGVGIVGIAKTSTSGLVDTYTITYTNGTTSTFQITNGENGTDGVGITSITKTSTSGLVDTYTITYTNGTTSTFQVTNGEDGEVTEEQFETLQNRVEYLAKYSNALIKNSNTETTLTINDTAECPMPMSLSPSESSQIISTGANVFKNSNNIWYGSSAGKVNYDSSTDIFTFHRDTGFDYLIQYGTLNIEASSDYILYLDVKENTMTNSFRLITSGFLSKSESSDVLLTAGATGVYTFPLTSKASATTYDMWLYCNSAGTLKAKIMLIKGTTLINYEPYTNEVATPSPTYLQTIHTISGNNTITIANSDNTENQNFTINLGNLEYCKIGNYSDEFYLATDSDTGLTAGKWYLKKNVGKVILNGSESWSKGGSNQHTANTNLFYMSLVGKKQGTGNLMSNYFINRYVIGAANDFTGICGQSNNSIIYIRIDQQLTVSEFKNWLSTHNTIVYYVLATPEYTLLNNTLQSQLNEIHNWAYSYQNQTNITQTNNDLPFIINTISCYDLNKLLTRLEILESEV